MKDIKATKIQKVTAYEKIRKRETLLRSENTGSVIKKTVLWLITSYPRMPV